MKPFLALGSFLAAGALLTSCRSDEISCVLPSNTEIIQVEGCDGWQEIEHVGIGIKRVTAEGGEKGWRLTGTVAIQNLGRQSLVGRELFRCWLVRADGERVFTLRPEDVADLHPATMSMGPGEVCFSPFTAIARVPWSDIERPETDFHLGNETIVGFVVAWDACDGVETLLVPLGDVPFNPVVMTDNYPKVH